MDRAEFNRLVDEAREDYQRATAALQERVARAQQAIERAEKKLALIRESYRKRVQALTAGYVGIEAAMAPSEPAAEPAPKPERQRPPAGAKRKRGVFDQPVLGMIREHGVSPITVPAVTDAWNLRHPDQELKRSTVRGILERHARKQRLRIADPGGRGSDNPRRYGLPVVVSPVPGRNT